MHTMLDALRRIILHVSLIEGIGPAVIQKIAAGMLHGACDDLYRLSAHELRVLYNLTLKQADTVVKGLRDTKILETELNLIATHDIQWATLVDDDYPSQLKTIHLPPPVLYWRGNNILSNQKSLAIVGSRRANHYGQRVVHALVEPLVHNGWTIVSGGALGIDTMAHAATVRAGGTTIVVLGSGLLCRHPVRNTRLFDDVVHTGSAIVSSFPLTMQAFPGNFPARNRIIAGLSKGCIVVQAARKSGARITARYALDQGRDVFAVPGIFDDALSEGCHALLSEGAKVVTSADDIMAEYEPTLVVKQTSLLDQKNTAPKSTTTKQKKETILHDTGNPAHNTLLSLCAQPTSVHDLMVAVECSMQQTQAMLFELQLHGRMQQDFTGKWYRI